MIKHSSRGPLVIRATAIEKELEQVIDLDIDLSFPRKKISLRNQE